MSKTVEFNKIVKEEKERILKAEKDFEDRNVKYDLEVFEKACNEMYQLSNGEVDKVVYDYDMWHECHESLDQLIDYLNLKGVDNDVDDINSVMYIRGY